MQNENKNTNVVFPDSGAPSAPASVNDVQEPPSSLQAFSLDPTDNQTVAQETLVAAPQKKVNPLVRFAKRADVILAVLIIVGGVGLAFMSSRGNTPAANTPADRFETTEIPLADFVTDTGIAFGAQSVVINGSLQANDSLIINPSLQPANAKAGQIYYDQQTNQLAYYNGSQFVALAGQTAPQEITTGVGLAFVGGQISNSGVLSIQGQSGNVTLNAGNGIAINGTIVSNAGVISVASGSPSLTVSNDGNGNVTITGTSSGTVSSPGGTSGNFPLFTGSQTIDDSIVTQTGLTVTITGDLSVVTGGLTLSNALTVSNGGTGATSLALNGVLVGQGTGAITSVAAGGAGLCLVSTAGAPTWGACPGGGGVSSLNGQTGALNIANASGAAGTITIDDASTSTKGIAQFNGTNFNVGSGIVNTVQNINTGATPTFAGVNTNSITPSAALTVGATGQQLTLQGNGNTAITATADGFTTTVAFDGTATGDVIYQFDRTVTTGTYGVCTTAGNCVGTGGGVSTPGGTTNRLAKFTGSQSIDDSTITDDGTNVTTSVDLVIQGGSITVGVPSSQSGAITLAHSGSANTGTIAQGALTGNRTYTLPDASGEICLSIGNCSGSGSSNTLQAAYAAGNIITTTDARDIDIELANTATDSNFDIVVQDDSTGFVAISREDGVGTNSPAQLLVIDNLDGNQPIANGVTVRSAGGGITDAIDASDAEIVNALNAGDNAIVGGAASIDFTNFDVTGAGNITAAGNVNLTAGQYQINGSQISSANLSNDANLAKLNGSQTFTGNSNAFQNGSNSTSAFSVQNASGNRILTVDSSNGEVELGLGSTLDGRLVFNNVSNANTITVVPSAVTGNRTITLPDSSGIVCLDSGNCAGVGATLQTAYNFSAGGTTPKIKVNSTLGGVDIQDADTTIGANLLSVRDSNGGGLGSVMFGVSSTGQVVLQNSANSTTAFRVLTQGGTNVLTADTTNGVVILGQSSTLNGSIIFNNSTNANQITLTTAVATGPQTITLPNSTGEVCLTSGNCSGSGSSNTLQAAYDAGNTINSSTGRDVEINLQDTATDANFLVDLQCDTSCSTNGRFAVQDDGVDVFTVSPAGGGVTVAEDFTHNNGNFSSNSTSDASLTAGGAVTITAGAASTWSTTTGNLVLIAQGSLNLGNGGGGTINIGTNNNAHTITVGNQSTAGVQAIVIGSSGNTGNTLSLEAGTGAGSIAIGNGATAHDIQVGTGAAAQSITIGSTNSTSSLSLQAGSGNISLNSGGTIELLDTTNVTGGFGQSGGNFSSASTGSASLTAGGSITITAGGGSTWSTSSGNLTVSANGTSTLNLQTSGAGTVNLGNQNSTTINIGSGSNIVRAVNIATGGSSQAQTVTVGSTGGASATTIQGGSGNVVLATSNGNRVQVGSASTDATAVLFTVDSYNNGTDPTGTNGAIYYNTSTNMFRCFQDGAWMDCITASGGLVSLQNAYTNSTGGTTPEIKLDSTRGAVDIQDADSTIGTSLFNIRGSNGSGLGALLFSIDNVGTVQVAGGGSFKNITTADASTATALGVQPGDSTASNGTGADLLLTGGSATSNTCGTACTGGTIYLQGGSATGSSGTRNGGSVFIDAGTGNSANGTIGIGTSSSADITIGRTTGGSSTTLQAGTGGVNIGVGGVANTIQIGNTTGAVAQTINIGNNATGSSTNTVVLGSTVGTSATTIQGGTGDITITSTDRLLISTVAGNAVSGFSLNTTMTNGSGLQAGNRIAVTLDPGGTSSGSHLTNQSIVDLGSTGTTFTGDIVAHLGQINWSGASNTSNTGRLVGSAGKVVTNSGAGSIQHAVGVFSQFQYAVGTTVTNSYSMYATNLQSGATTNLYGYYAERMTGGTNNYPLYLASSTANQAIFSVNGTGATTLRNDTNSSAAFQLQNSSGQVGFNLDTNTSNLINNPSFETNTTGWTAHGAAAISRVTNQSFDQQAGLLINATAAANDGARFGFTLASSTQYTLSMYIKGDGAFFSTLQIGRSENGSTDTSCATGLGTSSSNWNRVTCTFTTGTVSGSPYVYIKQTDATDRNFYIDAVQLELAASATQYRTAKASINGNLVVNPGQNSITNATLFVQSNAGGEGAVFRGNGDNNILQNVLTAATASGTTIFNINDTSLGTTAQGGSSFFDSAALQAISTSSGARAFDVFGASGQSVDIMRVRANGGTNLLTVGSAGAITSQNSTDSTTAFRILTSGGTPLFVVDTSNSRAYVGNPTGDTTGALLVLDTKTSAGDPTGVNGAMYYNSNLGALRCYQYDFWRDCVNDNPRTSYHVYSDLNGHVTSSNSQMDLQLWVNDSGIAGTESVAGEAGHPGILRNYAETSTGTALSAIQISTFDDNAILLGGGNTWRYETVVRVPTLSNGTNRFVIRSGFLDTYGSADGGDGCYFKYSDNVNGGEWQGLCSDAGSSTCDTNVAVSAGSWYRLTVVVNSTGTSADFQVNGTSACQVTSEIPDTAGNETGFANYIVKTAGATTRHLDTDYVDVLGQFSTPR